MGNGQLKGVDVPVVEGFEEDEVLLFREREHFPDLLRCIRHGLLAQDVLTRCERAHCPLIVQAIWQGVVDRVDLGVVEEV